MPHREGRKNAVFMPEKLQYENEIKSVLKRQISQDMDGLKGLNIDSFETAETS